MDAMTSERVRELESRIVRGLDQLLRDHAEWSRLQSEPPKPRKKKSDPSVVSVPSVAFASQEEPKPQKKPEAQKPTPKKTRPKRPATAADRARMRRLKQAQERLQEMGVKPWKAKPARGPKSPT